jgi:hypothetical protein
MNTLGHKYSLFNMINEYNKNKPVMDAYIKKYPIEHYDDQQDGGNADSMVLGMSIGIFILVLVINLILFIVALFLLVKHWKNLPNWAQIVSLISLLFGMPVITIIIVLLAKK